MNFIAFSSRASPSWRSRQDIPGRLLHETSALERSDAPIRIGVELGREGIQGLDRALDRGAVGGGLQSQQVKPRQRDIEGAHPPASSPIDERTRLGEQRAGSRAVT